MFGTQGKTAASGPMMLLKSLGFDPQAMITMFQGAQQIVVDFAKQAEQNHVDVLARFQALAEMVGRISVSTKENEQYLSNGFNNVVRKLDLIHADLKALNPDHAGDLGVPVEIDGDTVSIGEALAVKIDRDHFEKKTWEYTNVESDFTGKPLPLDEWLDYRATLRRGARR